MPRIRPPRQAAPDADLPVMEDHTPPTEDIEIALSDDDGGSAEIELAAPTVPEPEPAPQPQPAPSPDDALVRAAENARRADELQRQNAELMRRDREREEQLVREQTSRVESDFGVVLSSISTQEVLLEAARRDMRSAKASGDTDAEIDAVERITEAKAELKQLNITKQTFETRHPPEPERDHRTTSTPQSTPPDFEAKISKMPDTAKSWLRQHPEFINDATMNRRIGGFHRNLVDNKNVEAFSPAYFDALDTEFGFKAAPAAAPEPEPQPQPQRRSIPMTAPVSRDVPTASGQRQESNKVTLTAEERQIARTSFTASDMTNEQKELLYARNKQKLAQQRANGAYPQAERN